MVACFVYLGVLYETHRRTPSAGSFWWLFRTAKRNEGTYVLTKCFEPLYVGASDAS